MGPAILQTAFGEQAETVTVDELAITASAAKGTHPGRIRQSIAPERYGRRC